MLLKLFMIRGWGYNKLKLKLHVASTVRPRAQVKMPYKVRAKELQYCMYNDYNNTL